jgi:DNA-binding beta-propeller fold protein YncE
LADAGNNRVVILPSNGGAFTCVMRDPLLHSPHGLCFDPSGRALYVSDAGEPLVHVFESPDGRWNTDTERSAFRQRGISEEAFTKTKLSVPEEFRPLVGGLKGLDIDPSGRFLVGTCLNQPLSFFDTLKGTAESAGAESLLTVGNKI